MLTHAGIKCAPALLAACLSLSGQTPKPVYLDPAQPIDRRVEDLLHRMTLAEKLGQMNMPCAYERGLGTTIPAKLANCRRFIEGTYVEGQEVAQLYIHDVISSVTRPIEELKGFRKVALRPGERKTVQFELGFDELSFLNRNLERVVEPGTFRVMVGSSCQDIRLAGSFEVKP